MSVKITKQIFSTYHDLAEKLTELGFVDNPISNDPNDPVSNNHRWFWGPMGHTNISCYWEVKNGGAYINFKKSNNLSENTDYAFRSNLGFRAFNQESGEPDNEVGLVFIPLADEGCILYLTPLPVNTSITELTINCENEQKYNSETHEYELDENQLLYNGLVVYTPEEEVDEKWRCSWRSQDDTGFYWDVDTGKNLYEYGTETHQIPPNVQILYSDQTVVLTKAALQNGGWSNFIRVLVLGSIAPPGKIFKIHGQKYICITDNDIMRCPAFKLPPEGIDQNDPASTEEYSVYKKYALGDYCIYNDALWRCTRAITTPSPFDDSYWQVTTVDQEISALSLYGDPINNG